MSGDHVFRGAQLRATDVTAGYGGDPVIRGISVHVDPGQVVSLVGANGSGKSTLLKSLVGVVRVSAGTVTVGDVNVTNRPPEEVARAGVGYVPQVDDVFAPLTVRENLEMGGYLLPARQVRARIDHVVTVFPRLATMLTRPAGKLSGGQRRLVEIMRALMAEPQVLLLDEPMAGVHPNLARRIGNELSALCADGLTVLMVEHELAIMDEFCDPVVAMAEGAVLAEGTMAELRNRAEVVEAYLVG